jgi:hypothetical protein
MVVQDLMLQEQQQEQLIEVVVVEVDNKIVFNEVEQMAAQA